MWRVDEGLCVAVLPGACCGCGVGCVLAVERVNNVVTPPGFGWVPALVGVGAHCWVLRERAVVLLVRCRCGGVVVVVGWLLFSRNRRLLT